VHQALFVFEGHHLTWDPRTREAHDAHYGDVARSRHVWSAVAEALMVDYAAWRGQHPGDSWVLPPRDVEWFCDHPSWGNAFCDSNLL
jgi:hypothetical protein